MLGINLLSSLGVSAKDADIDSISFIAIVSEFLDAGLFAVVVAIEYVSRIVSVTTVVIAFLIVFTELVSCEFFDNVTAFVAFVVAMKFVAIDVALVRYGFVTAVLGLIPNRVAGFELFGVIVVAV